MELFRLRIRVLKIRFWSKTCGNTKYFLPKDWKKFSNKNWKRLNWTTFCESCKPLWSNALQEAVGHSCLKLQITLPQLQLRDMQSDGVMTSSSHQENKLYYSLVFPLVQKSSKALKKCQSHSRKPSGTFLMAHSLHITLWYLIFQVTGITSITAKCQ